MSLSANWAALGTGKESPCLGYHIAERQSATLLQDYSTYGCIQEKKQLLLEVMLQWVLESGQGGISWNYLLLLTFSTYWCSHPVFGPHPFPCSLLLASRLVERKSLFIVYASEYP